MLHIFKHIPTNVLMIYDREQEFEQANQQIAKQFMDDGDKYYVMRSGDDNNIILMHQIEDFDKSDADLIIQDLLDPESENVDYYQSMGVPMHLN